jgi:steroid delta-isomerase-like uncharacterized protein
LSEQARAAVRRYLDALNAGDADLVAACVTGDFFNEHTSALAHSRRGRDEYRRALDGFLASFGGLRYEVEDMIAEDDRVAVAYTMVFDWTGDDGISRPVRIRGMFRFRVEGGLIAHRVDYWDSGEFRRQVGPG